MRTAAVVLYDQRVAAQAEDLGETADDGRQVVEGVGNSVWLDASLRPNPG
ncbi:MAG TPA: hypothetical protein VME19_05620 [Streptosporangiaceae bacterium]|nr:hypothetical protein [Streptosporangiaceae bacterium]